MSYYKNLQIEDLDGEVWVDAYGYDGYYEVSNLGRIKSLGRWVSNGKSERWVKEKIRAQAKSKDGRLTCPFSVNGTTRSINVSALIYQSFYTGEDVYKKNYCVMHKNKIQSDNRLDNMILKTYTESHKVNFEKGLLPHLKRNNEKKSQEYKKLTHKICKVCKNKKAIEKFDFGRNTCKKCRSSAQKERYYYKKLKKQ